MAQTTRKTNIFPHYTFSSTPTQTPQTSQTFQVSQASQASQNAQMWSCTRCKTENRVTAKRCASCHHLQPVNYSTPRAFTQGCTFTLRSVYEAQTAKPFSKSSLAPSGITASSLMDYEQHCEEKQRNSTRIIAPAAEKTAMVPDGQPDDMALDLVCDLAEAQRLIEQLTDKDGQPDGDLDMLDSQTDEMAMDTMSDDETVVELNNDRMDQE